MIPDATYLARRLYLLGEWDAALALLGPDGELELRAEIAVDGWFFRIEGHDEAEKAVAALDPASWTAQLLTGRLAYSRLLFQHAPRPGDRAASEAAYRAAAGSGDELQRGWAEYHWGVLLDNIDEDTTGAVARYEAALEIATKYGDGFFESYIIRHLAHLKDPAEGIAMLRRSLHLPPLLAPGHRSSPRRPLSRTTCPKTTPSAPSSSGSTARQRTNYASAGSSPPAERADDPRVRRERRTCVIDRAHRMNRHIGAACSQRSRTGVGVGGHHVGVLRTAVEIHGHPRCPVATDLVGCTDRPEKLARRVPQLLDERRREQLLRRVRERGDDVLVGVPRRRTALRPSRRTAPGTPRADRRTVRRSGSRR